MKKNIIRKLIATAGIFLLLMQSISAQKPDTLATAKKWRFLLEPYIMFANINGTIGTGRLPDIEVNADPSDVFSKLQFGAMLNAEIYNEYWAITSDLIYMDLSSDILPRRFVNAGEVESKQLAWELAVLKRLLPWLEAGIGAQLNSLKTEVKLIMNTTGGPAPASANVTKTWVDPTVIGRATFPIAKKVLLQVRANVGGFGIGSDFAWQVQTYVNFRLSKVTQLSAGYRVIGVDYEKGNGDDRFLYQTTTFGPVLKVGFNF